jgi:hypothetical protein
MKKSFKRSPHFFALLLTGILMSLFVPKYSSTEQNLDTVPQTPVPALRVPSVASFKKMPMRQITAATFPDAKEIPAALQGKLSLFILAGQSNMSGRGWMSDELKVKNPKVFVFGNDYLWHLASEPVDNATGQIDKISEDLGAGFSPSMAFATQLLKYNPDQVIGLIPCARGGSAISQWQRNLSANSLYGSCLRRVQMAASQGKIAGFLFFQGEADALDPTRTPRVPLFPMQWATQFSTLINNFRQDLSEPNLPVIFAQIGSTRSPHLYINWQQVQQQQTLAKIPNSRMIQTNDLPLQDDVHFTTDSYQIIGERFAEAFWQLTQPKPVNPQEPL